MLRLSFETQKIKENYAIFYLKTDGDNLLHATILYPDDIADDDTIFPKSEFYYQEELSPDKNVSLEYHVYDSDEEAIAYIIEQMKDWKPSEWC